MSHPLVDADHPFVADLLASTLEILREAGGFIAPTTRLVEHGGQLRIESIGANGEHLLRIPRECFVRVDRVTWAERENRMVIVEVPDDFSDIETEMLYLQVALHNACGKLEWMQRTHPSLDPNLPDELIDAVRRLIPSFRTPLMAPTDVLWANRCFRIPMPPSGDPERVLVPIVDLLNHHGHGAVGDWTGQSFDVVTRKPFGTGECALNYGMNRNALEMAVVYGFFDTSSTASGPHGFDRDALRTLASLTINAQVGEPAWPLRQAAVFLLGQQ